jgi:hypothetical protein
VKRTEKRTRTGALNESEGKVSVLSYGVGGKTDSLTFLSIMKNVRVAKPSSPTDNAGISASNLSTWCKERDEALRSTAVNTVLTVVIRPMLTSDKSTTADRHGSDISVRN